MYKLLILVASLGATTAYDVVIGKCSGIRIYDEQLTESPTFWKRSRIVSVNTTNNDVISRVVVTDNRPDKNGEVHVLDGGEGKKSVTIELKSPTVLRGYDFHVEVYAEPEDEYKKEIYDVSATKDVKVPVMIGKDIDVNTNTSVVNGDADTVKDAASNSTKLSEEREMKRRVRESGDSPLLVLPIEIEDNQNDVPNESDETDSSDVEKRNVTTIIMHIDEGDETTETTTTIEDVPTTEVTTKEAVTTTQVNFNYKNTEHKVMIPVPYNRKYVN